MLSSFSKVWIAPSSRMLSGQTRPAFSTSLLQRSLPVLVKHRKYNAPRKRLTQRHNSTETSKAASSKSEREARGSKDAAGSKDSQEWAFIDLLPSFVVGIITAPFIYYGFLESRESSPASTKLAESRPPDLSEAKRTHAHRTGDVLEEVKRIEADKLQGFIDKVERFSFVKQEGGVDNTLAKAKEIIQRDHYFYMPNALKNK
ncbi:MAG: hypothetical protein M1836_001215 [Candelina mexicana]|nr:MAG: hypothetical protein M1836_001215 [Candelina mexicana]